WIDLVGKVVEHTVIRKRHEFMTDFLVDSFQGLLIRCASRLVVLEGGTGYGRHRENQWESKNSKQSLVHWVDPTQDFLRQGRALEHIAFVRRPNGQRSC